MAVGVHSGGTCRTCLDADNPARPWSPAGMCEHRSAGATLTLMDMRAPRAVDRCTLLRPSVFHRVATSSAREHFVFTRCARPASPRRTVSSGFARLDPPASVIANPCAMTPARVAHTQRS